MSASCNEREQSVLRVFGVTTGEGQSEENPEQVLNAALLALVSSRTRLACPHDLTQTGTATAQARTGEGRKRW